MATTVTLTTPDGDMDLYDAEPAGEARAAVIVVQEAFGVNPHIEDVTRRFAAVGYRAVAPSLFHRTGAPIIEYGDWIRPLRSNGQRFARALDDGAEKTRALQLVAAA